MALLAMLIGAFASGLLAFAVGTTTQARWVTVAHGTFGLGLLLLVPWKSVIVRRSLRRAGRRSGRVAGATLGLLLMVAIVAGVLHSVGGYRPVGGFTALTVHVAASALVVPLLLVHAWGRRQRPRRTDLSRRSLARAGAVGIGSLAAYGALEGTSGALGLPGWTRRETGSFEVGSGDPDQMPVTQWFTDSVPMLDGAGYRLDLDEGTLSYADLSASTDTVRAVLDCTGGWYAAQEWRGLRLDRAVTRAPAWARSVDVISVTGYRRRFPIADLERLLLATHAAGRPLSDGHGGPVRLVAPGRRGFWWVKWVRSVEWTAAPWWLQPPFPLH